MGIDIILAEDHRIVREGLKSLLEHRPDFKVVAEAANGREAVNLCRELGPDLVLMDIGMPQLNGVEATRQVRRDCPRTKVLALSMHSDPRFVADVLKAGAKGYLLKDSAFSELVRAVEAVAAGGTYLSRELAQNLPVDRLREKAAVDQSISDLSGRETEVLQLLAEGLSTNQIAESLGISPKTVEVHRMNIKTKLGIYTTAGLTKYAVRQRLTSL
jgi:two-component system, NarL family, response regulator NreC